MSRLSCGVVICAFTDERWADIAGAIDALGAQSVRPDEVVLVIDHNPELLARARAELPGAFVVANAEARGLSGGRNTGVRQIQSDVVAFLDDDAVPAPDWVERVVAAYDDPAVLGAGGHVEPIWPAGARPSWLPAEFDWTVGCSYVGLPERAMPVRNPIGASMSFRRDVFDTVGFFNASVGRIGRRPLGCEETEFCIRVRKAKPEAVILYDPSIVVRHRVTDARVTWAYFRSRCYSEGLSKATVSSLVGAGDALSAERSYTSSVLPRALRRELTASAGGDQAALHRAGAVGLGVVAAGSGYLRGTTTLRVRHARAERRRRRAAALDALPVNNFLPVKVLDVDLDRQSGELPSVQSLRAAGYGRVDLLVRRAGVPVALTSVDVADGTAGDALRMAVGAISAPAVTALPRPDGDCSMTVVVATHSRPGSLSRLLDSLRRVEEPIDVLVVDNAPHHAETAEVVQRCQRDWPQLAYVAEPRAGASIARNTGLALVATPYVAFTDDDVEVDTGWIAGLLAGFAVGPEVVCVTGLVLPAELETPAQVWFEEFGGFSKGLRPKVFDSHNDGGPLYPFTGGAFGSGNNVAFRTDALRRLGGYDERLGPGTATRAGEDLELFIRTVRSGAKLAYQPAALVRHWHRTRASELHQQLTNYGVGLSSAIALQALSDRGAAKAILTRLPAGARFLVSPRSTKNGGRSSTFPPELSRTELAGVIAGPFALLRSVLHRQRAA